MLAGLGELEAIERLAGLEAAGLVRRYRVSRREPDCFRISRAGASLIGTSFPSSQPDWRYRHCVGVVWLWLAARGGTFGEVDRVLSEREMRAADLAVADADRRTHHGAAPAPAVGTEEPLFGLSLDREHRAPDALHYPDLGLVMKAGRVPVQLQLTAPSLNRLETVLTGYGADPGVAAVLYLVADPGIGWAVQSAAARVELSAFVQVQPVTLWKH